mgnify:CR=1 FL=1
MPDKMDPQPSPHGDFVLPFDIAQAGVRGRLVRLDAASARALGYRHAIGVDLQLEAQHMGGQFGDDLNTVPGSADGQRGLVPALTLWNATATWRVKSLRSSFFVAVKNLADRTSIVDDKNFVAQRGREALAGLFDIGGVQLQAITQDQAVVLVGLQQLFATPFAAHHEQATAGQQRGGRDQLPGALEQLGVDQRGNRLAVHPRPEGAGPRLVPHAALGNHAGPSGSKLL